MKTVYVTDLDGTFLNNQSEVSEFTKNTVNSLIEQGMHFSFATARLGPSAIKLMKEIKINASVFLMQGALTYNFITNSYIDCSPISSTILEKTIDLFKKNRIPILLIGIMNQQLTIFYEELTPYLKGVYDEWSMLYKIPFIKVNQIKQILNHNIMYIYTINSYETLKNINDLLIQLDSYAVAFFDTNREDRGFNLECLNKDVSKYQAVMNLKNKYGYDKVIGFGDTTNDIPLLLACDEFYAPINANEQLKSMSTGIIDSNDADGVANFLLKHYKNQL